MAGRTTRFGTEPPERIGDFTEDELPDDQVVRRFFAVHEREVRHGDKRQRKPAPRPGDPERPANDPDADS